MRITITIKNSYSILPSFLELTQNFLKVGKILRVFEMMIEDNMDKGLERKLIIFHLNLDLSIGFVDLEARCGE